MSSRKRTLDQHHSFLKGIRRQLQQQAAELGLSPLDDIVTITQSDRNGAEEIDIPVAGAKPTLDLSHGFYLGIRRHLQRDAEELGIPPWGDGPFTDTAYQTTSAITAAQMPSG